jgi:solute:Na+ symporter, SSS family
MIAVYDKFIIAFYVVFMLAIGLLLRRLSRNTSDYFRCGGAMPWWITGTSAWLATFSAWTFTGAAGAIYSSGSLVLCLYYSNALGAVVLILYTGLRFRRMRTVTWMEAVRGRYGPFTEQFYTWLRIPILLFIAGVALNSIGVFMAAVFHTNVTVVMVILGTLVTIVSFAGGAWAVLASDFVQLCLIMTIGVVTAFLAVHQPAIGGLAQLWQRIPPSYFHWSDHAHLAVVFPWIAVMLWFGFSAANSMDNSTMFLMARSDRDARGMAIIPLLGCLVGPLIFFIPPTVAILTHPHLGAEFPQLKNPQEAAFVAVADDVMPQGLMGLLLCAMLGATLTNMDAAVNKGVGIFVRSFWKPMISPHASEKSLLRLGKACTLIFGAIIVTLGVIIGMYRKLELFDLTNQVAASLLGPMLVPLVWGMFVKKTPGWTAWSTAVLGFAIALGIQFGFRPEYFQHWMGWKGPLNSLETADINLAASGLGIVVICSAWYFASTLFYDESKDPENTRRNEEFFRSLRTPIDAKRDGVADYGQLVYRLIGGLCLFYGGFILLLMLIPNTGLGRLCFLFCGGVIFTLGAALYFKARASSQRGKALEIEAVAVVVSEK